MAAEILQQATALVTFICTLGVPGRHGPGVVPPRIHLESFILPHCRWERTEKRLLDALTAPALQHLTISEYELGSEPLSTITAFLSSNARSDCEMRAAVKWGSFGDTKLRSISKERDREQVFEGESQVDWLNPVPAQKSTSLAPQLPA
ncbi:hypothetical protein C8J57DRAFT_1255778 [Mycena rebaudengoi]|nr:hypothetical protein C8J57DRAFT_1255778 [Mycena rebaudengoi]